MLYTAIRIGNRTAKNRIVRSATWEALADRDGSIHEDTYRIYRELAEGGTGTIITGFTSVDGNNLRSPRYTIREYLYPV